MNPQQPIDFLTSIRSAHAIHAVHEIYFGMVQLAELFVQRGWTQEAADILAFVVQQDNLPHDIFEQADELFDDLERSICPRVIWDAREFASGMDMDDMVAYLLADD